MNSSDRLIRLEKENRYLRCKSQIKDFCIPILHFSLVAFVSYFIRLGIDQLSKRHFRDRSVIAGAFAYLLISVIFFPIIGCVVMSCYSSIQDIRDIDNKEILVEKADIQIKDDSCNEKGIVTRLWQSLIELWHKFTNPQNLKKNIAYFSIVGACDLFLGGLYFVTKEGINALIQDRGMESLKTKLVLNVLSAVSLAIISVIFAIALERLLWREKLIPKDGPETELQSSSLSLCSTSPLVTK